ncbi:hypothetical protein PVAP13_6NG256231 [Panicum virgatum]|uniref:Uncharacterized protein n=1 Tax=Panicum virgatum TaxID=38727 RepID=A0A8T0R447_PANVG|nr:hypothetical protein PVAP13_6NG256231 [Panicum virgatum]
MPLAFTSDIHKWQLSPGDHVLAVAPLSFSSSPPPGPSLLLPRVNRRLQGRAPHCWPLSARFRSPHAPLHRRGHGRHGVKAPIRPCRGAVRGGGRGNSGRVEGVRGVSSQRHEGVGWSKSRRCEGKEEAVRKRLELKGGGGRDGGRRG